MITIEQYKKNLTILYIEDDQTTQHKLKNILERYFSKVILASNGEDDFLERFKVLSNEEIGDLSQSLLKAQNLIIKMRALNENKENMD